MRNLAILANGNPDVPISGIEISITAGGLLGLKKLRRKRNAL
jgi:hypothetical protein